MIYCTHLLGIITISGVYYVFFSVKVKVFQKKQHVYLREFTNIRRWVPKSYLHVCPKLQKKEKQNTP